MWALGVWYTQAVRQSWCYIFLRYVNTINYSLPLSRSLIHSPSLSRAREVQTDWLSWCNLLAAGNAAATQHTMLPSLPFSPGNRPILVHLRAALFVLLLFCLFFFTLKSASQYNLIEAYIIIATREGGGGEREVGKRREGRVFARAADLHAHIWICRWFWKASASVQLP